MACCVAPVRSLLALFKNTFDDTDQEQYYKKQNAQGTEGKKLADSCVPVTAAHRGLPGTDVTVVIQLHLRVEWDSDRMTHAGR